MRLVVSPQGKYWKVRWKDQRKHKLFSKKEWAVKHAEEIGLGYEVHDEHGRILSEVPRKPFTVIYDGEMVQI